VHLLLQLCSTLLDSANIDSARYYANKAVALAEKINFAHGKRSAYYWLGTLNSAPAEKRNFFFKAIKVYEEAGEKHLTGRMFLEIANSYWFEENYPEALNYSYIALKLLEQAGQKENMAYTYLRLAAYYETEGNFSESIKDYFQALKLAEEVGAGSRGKYAAGESNRGLANVFTKLGKLDEALKRDSVALQIFTELGEPFNWSRFHTIVSTADIFKTQGDIAFAAGNITLAKTKFSEALKTYQSAGDFGWNAHCNTSIAKIKIKLHDLPTARIYMLASLEIANATKSKNDFEEAYSGWVALDSAEGNFSKAFEHYKQYILYRDSIYSKENTEKTTRVKMQYQFDKTQAAAKAIQDNKDAVKNAEIKNQKLLRNFSFMGTFAVLSFGSYSFYRFRKKKQLQSQQALMNERLRISRELHDEVGATLSGIAMYSHLTREQIKQANTVEVEKSLNIMQQSAGEMVNKLNDIVWLVNPDQDSMQKLIQRLEEYARDMAAIKSMQIKVNVPENLHEHSLPMESRRNIYLFCKEAINNAVKYSNGTLLELNITEVDNKLEFSVSDNGKGFDAIMVRRGNGLGNMQKRADEIGAKLTLQSKQDEGSFLSMQIKIT